MNTEKNLEIVGKAADRCFALIDQLDAELKCDCSALLGNAGALLGLRDTLLYARDRDAGLYDWAAVKPVKGPELPVEEAVTEEPVVEKAPAGEVPTEEVPAEKEDEFFEEETLDPEVVRAALGEARKAGVNVAAILKEFGANNFTRLKAEDYPAVMAKLKEVN